MKSKIKISLSLLFIFLIIFSSNYSLTQNNDKETNAKLTIEKRSAIVDKIT